MIKLIYHDDKETPKGLKNWFRGVKPPVWELDQDLYFEIDGKIDFVPKGLLTDLSSVPKFLWSIFPPFGKFLEGAIIHDYLYKTRKYKRKISDLKCYQYQTRKTVTRLIII